MFCRSVRYPLPPFSIVCENRNRFIFIAFSTPTLYFLEMHSRTTAAVPDRGFEDFVTRVVFFDIAIYKIEVRQCNR